MLLPVAIAACVFQLAATTSADVLGMSSRAESIDGSTAQNKSSTSADSRMSSIDVSESPSIADRLRTDRDCNQRSSATFVDVVSRSTKYKLNVEDRIGQLRAMHVQHNLQGTVEIQDGGADSHVIEIELNAAADTLEVLDDVTVTKRFIDTGQQREQQSILVLAVGFKERTRGAATGQLLTGIIMCISGVLVTLSILVIVRRRRHTDDRHVVNSLTGNEMSTLSATNCSDQLQNVIWKNTFIDTPTDLSIEEASLQTVRRSPIPAASAAIRGSPRMPLTSLTSLTAIVVCALATSVGVTSMCVRLAEANVTIRIPRSLNLDALQVSLNRTTSSFTASQWSQQNSSRIHVNGGTQPEWSALPAGKILRREADGEHMTSDDVMGSGCIHPYICSHSSRQREPTSTTLDEECPFEVVDKSPNVFIDDLLTARSLETNFYVTDSKQQTDFFWHRPSGLRINVGLQDIDIVPMYEEVDHGGGDTNFVLSSPAVNTERDLFKSIHRQHCRNPIPDYYGVTLEVLKDRATLASTRPCTEDDYSGGRCREDEINYVERTINDACHKMGSYPEPLLSADNSVVCTDASKSMLTQLFNITPSIVRPITFPSEACKTSRNRCDQCLVNGRCMFNDVFERTCCQLNCYTLQDCKMASSAECTKRKIECALGDSYRYTLTPVFNDIGRTFRCHASRRVPDVLYRLWFYVTVPGGLLETQRIFVDVTPASGARDQPPSALPSSSSSTSSYSVDSGRFTFDDFLTVEFDTRRRFADDVILTGTHTSAADDVADSGSRWVHSVGDVTDYVQPATPDGAAVDTLVHRLSDNGYVTSVVFDEPFAYSTSNWVKDDRCTKNVTKFRQLRQPISSSNGRDVAMPVSVITDNDPNGSYKYLVRIADEPPQMKIALPGSASLLRWWFRDKNITLIKDGSLRVHMTSNDTLGLSFVHIEGHVSDCPAYLAVTIKTWPPMSSSRTLVNYDVLVSCPPHFSLTLTLPPSTSQSSVHDVDDPLEADCALELLLDDQSSIYNAILVNRRSSAAVFDVPTSRPMSPQVVLPVESDFATVDESSTVKPNFDNVIIDGDDNRTIAIVTFVVVAMAMTSLITCIDRYRMLRDGDDIYRRTQSYGKTSSGSHDDDRKRSDQRQRQRRRRHHQQQQPDRKSSSATTHAVRRVVRVTCVVMKIVCSFGFTFTVLFIVVDAGLWRKIDDIYVDITRTQNRKLSGEQRCGELVRTVPDDDVDKPSASSNHSTRPTFPFQSFAAVCFNRLIATTVNESVETSRRRQTGNEIFYSSLVGLISRQRATLRGVSGSVATALLLNVGEYSNKSARGLANALKADWLLYPMSLFNKSTIFGDSRRYRADTPANFVVEFGRFIDVIEPETVRHMTAALRARSEFYTTVLLRQFSAPVFTRPCDDVTSTDRQQSSSRLLDVQTRWQRLDSARYFSSHPAVDGVFDSPTSGPTSKHYSLPGAASCLSSTESVGGATNTGSISSYYVTGKMNALSANIRLDVVQIVFALLDVVVVFRRWSLLMTKLDRGRSGRQTYSCNGRSTAHSSATSESHGGCNGGAAITRPLPNGNRSEPTNHHKENGFRFQETDSGGETAWDCHTDGSVGFDKSSAKRWPTSLFECTSSRSRRRGCCGCRRSESNGSSPDDFSTSKGISSGLLQRFYLCLTVIVELYIVVKAVDLALYSFVHQCCPPVAEQGIDNFIRAMRKIDETFSADMAVSLDGLRTAELTDYIFVMTSLEQQATTSAGSDERAAWWNATEAQSRCLLETPTTTSHQTPTGTSALLAYSGNTDPLSTVRFVRQLTIAVWNCVLLAVVGIVLFEFLDRLLSNVLVRCSSVDLQGDDDVVIDLSPTLSKSETISAANSFVSSLSQQSREFQSPVAPASSFVSTSHVADESSIGNGCLFRDVISTAPPTNCLKRPYGNHHHHQQQQQQQQQQQHSGRRCPSETDEFVLQRPRVRFAPTVGTSSNRLCVMTLTTPSSHLHTVNYLDMDSIESNV